MKVGIACDHGGYELKQTIASFLEQTGVTFKDYGAYELDPLDDFPDYIIPLARAVQGGEVNRGIAICGSGIGASVAANKVAGIRASLVTDTYSAHQGVEHDDMNVICLGGRITGVALALEIVNSFLEANYQGGEKYQRRLDKIIALEQITTPKNN